MAFTKLEKDMNIIQKLDNEPNDVGGLTSAEMKAKFDEPANAVKDWINNTFIPEAEETLRLAKLESVPDHASRHAASGTDPITPHMIGAVNKAGDTMTGPLIVRDASIPHDARFFSVEKYAALGSYDPDNADWSQLMVNNDLAAHLANSLVLQRSDGSWYSVLHTGNKPSGSYTGNGSNAARTIDTGGIGAAVFIYSADGHGALLTGVGAILKYGTNLSALSGSAAYVNGGKIILQTANEYLNANGVEHYYQVL